MMTDYDATAGGWQTDGPAPAEPTTPPSVTPSMMPQQRPEAPATSAVAPEGDEHDDADDFTDLHAARKIRSENKNLRGRLRDAESERDGLQAVVDGFRRGEVERLAAAELHDARDLLDRHEVGEFLDESGNVDPGKVSAAARALTTERPHMAAPPVVTAPPTDRPIEGLTPGASPQRTPQETTWHSFLGGGIA